MTSSEKLGQIELSSLFLVARVRVFGLFGKHSFEVTPIPEGTSELGAPPLMLVYGDNGGGKTTLLRLLWHLLSPATNRGHRTELLRTQFYRLVVLLGTGDVISVEKAEPGVMEITVRRRGRIKARAKYAEARLFRRRTIRRASGEMEYDYIVTHGEPGEYSSGDSDAFVALGGADPDAVEDEYTEYLGKLAPQPFLLADDRRIHADAPMFDPARTSRETVRRLRNTEDGRADRKTGLAGELDMALFRITEWLRSSVFSASKQGSQSVNVVYQELLRELTKSDEGDELPQLDDIRQSLYQLEDRTRQFNEFDLAPKTSVQPFMNILKSVSPTRADLAARILQPFISGQNARLDSLQETEGLVRTFVDNINEYLEDKTVSITPTTGVSIVTSDGSNLDSSMLSSGERQLLLLFSNAFLARSRSSLFLIDEPELSLNIKWQRKLVQSLLDIVKGSSVQFIMATHSVEIITRHRQYLARLEPINGPF